MPAPVIHSVVTVAPPPPNFCGDVKAVFELLAQNIQVRNPSGYNTFVVSANAPLTDSGPWLKDGKEWWVWNPITLVYEPQRSSDLFTRDLPTVTSMSDAKVASGTSSGLCFLQGSTGVRMLRYLGGGSWGRLIENLRGPTADRPVTPLTGTKYFDTTIGCEIYWNGSAWTTVSGCYGDIKAVEFSSEADALKYNPGWAIAASVKGRAIAGHNGSANGFTEHAPWDIVGAETHTLTKSEMPDHNHAIWGDVNDTAEESGAGRLATSYQAGWEAWCWTENWGADTPYVEGGADHGYPVKATRDQPHNNMQPTVFLIHLRKTVV